MTKEQKSIEEKKEQLTLLDEVEELVVVKEDEMPEKVTETVAEPTIEEIEAQMKEKAEEWLNNILTHPIKVVDEKNSDTYIDSTVGDIIDPERDIWFSYQKNKPIIKETGTNKLIKATGAKFPKVVPIEKQSDYKSGLGQVWIEATVYFPNGETNEEYGVANAGNCPDPISRNNMPIMAKKRAKNRAFYRSDYIGLYDVYDENEILDIRDEKTESKIQMMQNEINNLREELKEVRREKAHFESLYEKTTGQLKRIKNQLAKEILTKDGVKVWSITDVEQLLALSKGKNLAALVAKVRIEHLNKKTSKAIEQ